MKIIRYIVLALFLFNIPSFAFIFINSTISNLLSLLSFGALLVYYAFSEKSSVNSGLISVGLTYFAISSLVSQQFFPSEIRDYYIFIIKYFIIILCGYELIKKVSQREFFIFLLIGAASFLLEIIFPTRLSFGTGRFSGFYLNPNLMGFICGIGYGISYGTKNKGLKLLGQVIFSIVGFLSFSRTFIVIWLLINLISIKISLKNVRIFIYGLGLLLLIIIFKDFLPFQNERLDQIETILLEGNLQESGVEENSRTETWAIFYDYIFSHPLFGNGYDSFGGGGLGGHLGVHNTYLKILGESGLIPFLLFLFLVSSMIIRSFHLFKRQPHLFLACIGLSLYMLTNHTFFYNGVIIFVFMWIQFHSTSKELNSTLND
jgi:O-antigen ligase